MYFSKLETIAFIKHLLLRACTDVGWEVLTPVVLSVLGLGDSKYRGDAKVGARGFLNWMKTKRRIFFFFYLVGVSSDVVLVRITLP